MNGSPIHTLMCAASLCLCAPILSARAQDNTTDVAKTVNMSLTATKSAFEHATNCLREDMARKKNNAYFNGFGEVVPVTTYHGLACSFDFSQKTDAFRATVESGEPDLYPETNVLPGKIYVRVDGKISDGVSGGYRFDLTGYWRKRNVADTAFVIGELKQSFTLADGNSFDPKEVKTEETVYTCARVDETCGPAAKGATALSDDDYAQAAPFAELFAEVKNFAVWSSAPKRPTTVFDALTYLPPADIDACFDLFFGKHDLKLVGGGPFKGMLFSSYRDVRCTGSFYSQPTGNQLSLLATTDAALKASVPPAGSVLFTSVMAERPSADGKTATVDMRAIADTSRDGGNYLNGIMRHARAVADTATKNATIVDGRQIYIRHPVTPLDDKDFIVRDLSDISDEEARDHARLSDWLDSLASRGLTRMTSMGERKPSAKSAPTRAPGG